MLFHRRNSLGTVNIEFFIQNSMLLIDNVYARIYNIDEIMEVCL